MNIKFVLLISLLLAIAPQSTLHGMGASAPCAAPGTLSWAREVLPSIPVPTGVRPKIWHFVQSVLSETNLTALMLDHKNITTDELAAIINALPQIIKESMHYLHLAANRLTSLPDTIRQLTGLMELNLRKNDLTSLPFAIEQLTSLEYLDLSGNRLTHLPDAILQLTDLGALVLDNNQLTSLPDAIGQLTGLKFLYLSGNRLTHLPDAIGQLPNLQLLNIGRDVKIPALRPEVIISYV